MRIAVLEDDQDQLDLLTVWLKRLDAEVDTYQTGQALLKVLKKQHYDLFLLDWELPDTTGIEVVKWIRNHLDWRVPVIFLTLRDEEKDIVTALDSGADDYICKPLTPDLTLARIQTVLRRAGSGTVDRTVIDAPPYRIDLNNRSVTVNGKPVAITQREFSLATYLFQNPSRVLSRETLLKDVWGIEAQLNTRTVDTHVCRVRNKLEIGEPNGWLLHSIYQYGYRLESLRSD